MRKLPSSDIERWVQEHVAAFLETDVATIALDRPFEEIGVDSVTAMEMLDNLEVLLDCRIPDDVLDHHRDIRALARHLSDRADTPEPAVPDGVPERRSRAPRSR